MLGFPCWPDLSPWRSSWWTTAHGALLQTAESYREKKFAAKDTAFRIVCGRTKKRLCAINGACPMANGEIPDWPDSDDRLEPESVEKRVRFLGEHPQYQCVRSSVPTLRHQTGERKADRTKNGATCLKKTFLDILEFRTFVCAAVAICCGLELFLHLSGPANPEYPVGQNLSDACCHLCTVTKSHYTGRALRRCRPAGQSLRPAADPGPGEKNTAIMSFADESPVSAGWKIKNP